ncbi:MAG: tetratricopeptide repeat protein [Coleofasciculus chthonoplastes F3-SA18-01]|uniref:tetratricopeptide repeat protein n=1 Tax=Coleofasciculus chthonoplastes TaxID=64178 RepID=UPI0032F28F09
MQVLHLDLKPVGENDVELRYFSDNPNQYKTRSLPLAEITDLIGRAERDYYVRLAVDYTITGRKLYNWLDGSDRFLQRLLNQSRREGIVLAINAAEQLAHLPWEVLHDGSSFLVQKLPAVIPLRWVSLNTRKLEIDATPQNRALNVLFMATSPLGIEPVLDFEAEEGRILKATARQPLSLTVEESGCLSELGYLVGDYDKGYFDVLHLTGHATFVDGEPRFYTETEIGEPYLASAEDIARELQFRLPKLIFLSGCRTGQAGKSGAIPSMAEALLNLGVTAVLGWGQKVLDEEATTAAAALYQALSAGKTLTQAVALTYQELIKNKARDWHLLRLYGAETLPGALVTPVRTRGRKPAPPPTVATQFLDTAGTVKVPTRESFVGRRRQLQNCLRALKPPSEDIGVLIHGMGGLGKSSLAARLCDRLSEFQRLVWVGRVDEPSLVNKLAAALDSRELREALQDNREELKFRLRRVFRLLLDPTLAHPSQGREQPFLLVLDDFEVNLESRNDGYVLQPEAAEVLEALVWAIQDNYAPHRLIITCRYDFESSQLQYFYKQVMDSLRGADLPKKCNRLTAFGSESQVDEALQAQAQRLADGNPRLLEWLDKVLLNLESPQLALKRGEKNTVAEILARLEADPVELREKVLAKELLNQMDQPMREMLSRGLVFELPVPREAFIAVCRGGFRDKLTGNTDNSEAKPALNNVDEYINRAIALGLLEVSPDESLRVPRILPLKLPEDAETLHRKAAEVLYRLWWKDAEETSGEQGLQILKLALEGKTKNIAIEITIVLASNANHNSLYWEGRQLCELTLESTETEDYCILHQMARAEQYSGDIKKAEDHYQQALKECPQEDKEQRAAIIFNFATLKDAQEYFEEAIKLYDQCLKIYENIDDTTGQAGQAFTLNGLGIIQSKLGNIEEAIALQERSRVSFKSINCKRGQASTLHCLGMLKYSQGNVKEAILYCQKSLEIDDIIEGKAATLHDLGIIQANQGKTDEAINCFEIALALYKSIGNVRGKGITLKVIGDLLADRKKQFTTALDYLQQSLEILQRFQSPEAEKVRQMIAYVQKMADEKQ